jgi:hypothetical protein
MGSLPDAIEAGAGLELVAEDELGAVITPVPLATYGEEILAERLADPTWTALRAMRHERVIEHFAQRVTVIPLRFGTIYLDRTGVRQMLAAKQVELQTTIERLRGRVEWGINVYCDRARLLQSIAAISPRLRELDERAASLPPGQAYLIQKQSDALRVDEAREEMKRITETIERELRTSAHAGKRLRVLKNESTEHGELIAKFAFLVKQANFEAFRASAEKLAQEQQDIGVQLQLTGPWPAYNFVEET